MQWWYFWPIKGNNNKYVKCACVCVCVCVCASVYQCESVCLHECCRHIQLQVASYGAYQIKLTTYKHLTSHEHFSPAKGYIIKSQVYWISLTDNCFCMFTGQLISNDSKIFSRETCFSRVISSYVTANWEIFRMNLHLGGLKLAWRPSLDRGIAI